MRDQGLDQELDEGLAEVVAEFVAESREGLDRLDRDLVALERDPHAPELLAGVFRVVHTIKGTSAFLGLARLTELAHAGEGLLAGLRDGGPWSGPTTDLLLALVDRLRALLTNVERTGHEGEVPVADLVAALGAAGRGADPGGTGAADPAPVPMLGALLIAAGAARAADVADAVRRQRAGDRRRLGELLVDLGHVDPAAVAEALARQEQPAGPTVRVGTDVLDRLGQLVGELLLVRRDLPGPGPGPAGPAAARLDRVAAELHRALVQARLTRVETAWARVPRLVRDVAAQCGKRVVLLLEGGDTEVDQVLVDALRDPLTHLVRNAVDHGIEPPDVRRAAGKPAEGRLTVRAVLGDAGGAAGRVVVEVGDDGAGIDPAAVARVAVARGLRSSEAAAAAGPEELLALLCQPGFSTAGRVTEVSGRGVGLDVVQTNLDRVGGQVEVHSAPGEGTTWRLVLPVNAAAVPVLPVECAGVRYAVPLAAVEAAVAGRRWPCAPGVPGQPPVDRVLAPERVAVTPLLGWPGYTGATVCADGVPALLVDPALVVNPATLRAGDGGAPAGAAGGKR